MRILVLVGSGEFTDAMIHVDNYLLSQTTSKTVAILPTAAGQEKHPHQWIQDGVRHFKKLHAKPVGVPVLKRNDTIKREYLEKIHSAAFIYFSGGYPGYLFDTLVDTPLWQFIYQKYKSGAVLAGCSAGAMIMGERILANGQELFMQGAWPPVWKKSFGLIPYSIFPHFDWARSEKKELFERIMKQASKDVLRQWIGIDEETALIISNEQKAQVMGKGTVHVVKNGKETIYKNGASFEM